MAGGSARSLSSLAPRNPAPSPSRRLPAWLRLPASPPARQAPRRGAGFAGHGIVWRPLHRVSGKTGIPSHHSVVMHHVRAQLSPLVVGPVATAVRCRLDSTPVLQQSAGQTARASPLRVGCCHPASRCATAYAFFVPRGSVSRQGEPVFPSLRQLCSADDLPAVTANAVRAWRENVIASSASLWRGLVLPSIFRAWPCPRPTAVNRHAPRPRCGCGCS